MNLSVNETKAECVETGLFNGDDQVLSQSIRKIRAVV